MLHVFVESNWIVEAFAAQPTPDASALLARAAAGDLQLHVPAVAVREGEFVIRRKMTGRVPSDLQAFRRSIAGELPEEAKVVARFFDRFLDAAQRNLQTLSLRLDALATAPGVEVFALSDAALLRVLVLRGEIPDLRPFDEAILAGVLTRATQLDTSAAILFCTLDSDLLPWDKRRVERPGLSALYADARIEVRSDFSSIPP